MNLQQLNPKILSITQLRRDIDALNRILEKEKEAIVMKNQKVLFVVVSPNRYQYLKKTREERIDEALKVMSRLRSKYKAPGDSVSDYVIKTRDERIKKWKK